MSGARRSGGGAARVAPSTGVRSPCISVCRMDEAGRYCVGCWRTLDEIGGWIAFSDDERRAVLAKLGARRREVLARIASPSSDSLP